MDGGALSAIGLAANILQFIDWVSHICEVGSQIRRNGASDLNLELEATGEELKGQLKRILPPEGTTMCDTRVDQSLRQISKQCSKVAADLEVIIKKYKSKLDQQNNQKSYHKLKPLIENKIRTLSQAIRSDWSKDKVIALSNKLDRWRKLLDSEILLNIRDVALRSATLLENSSANHRMTHTEVIGVIQQTSSETRTLLQDQNETINTINTFLKELGKGQLFPDLPGSIYQRDPYFKSASLSGHARLQDEIIGALPFRMMFEREDEITGTYQCTYDWIFEDPKDRGKPWTNFQNWLREGDGCYWIEGKAGSGKSTLMKYIYRHTKTQDLLKEWSGKSELITGSYFFWLAGSSLQKNQEGLLRSLLHTILTKRPDLVSRVFPKLVLYSTLMTRDHADYHSPKIAFVCKHVGCSQTFQHTEELARHMLQHTTYKEPSDEAFSSDTTNASYEQDVFRNLRLTELRHAFLEISKADLKGLKICLFVDGLDEFIGLPQDIITLFDGATRQSATLKMVLSSRPESEFKEAFRFNPSLRLEDLTGEDIRNYVAKNLHSHRRMRQLDSQDPVAATNLISAVTSRASGIFLWVVIVVQSLITGLSDGSYLQELEEVVNRYPEELGKLYKHMIARMKPSHRVQSSKLFQCVMRCLEVEGDLPSPLRLSYMDHEDPFQSTRVPIKLESPESLKERHSIIDDRLRSRCCGLLEVHYGAKSPGVRDGCQDVFSARIKFLHRSVSEFLRDPTVMTTVQGDTRNTRFNAFEHNMASLLFCFKSWHFFQFDKHRQWKLYAPQLKYFWVYFQLCESTINYEYLSSYTAELASVHLKLWKKPGFVQSPDGTEDISSAASGARGWLASVVDILRLSLGTRCDHDPMLTLSMRFGLSACFEERWLSGDTSTKPQEICSLLIRLTCWIMSSESSDIRKRQLFMFETLSQHEQRDTLTGTYSTAVEAVLETGPRTSFANRSAWSFLIHQRPLSVGRSHFPTRATDKADAKFDDDTEVDIFDDWASMVILCIKSGARLGEGYGGAKAEIQKQLRSLTVSTGFLTANNKRRVQLIEDRVHEALSGTQPAIRAYKKSATGPRTENMSQRRQQKRSVSKISRADSMALCPEDSTSTKDIHSSSWPEVNDTPCARCNAVTTITAMGYNAEIIFRALKEAGVGNDIPGIVQWLDNEKAGSLSTSLPEERHTNESSLNRMSSGKPETLALVSHVAQRGAPTLAPNSTSWAKVARSEPQTPKVMGANWIPPAVKTRNRRRGKKAPETLQRNETLVSKGMIELSYGNLTWFLDSKDGSGKEPMFTDSQAASLKEFLQTLMLT